MVSTQILESWEDRSLRILRKATIPQGIKASCTDTTNYGAVFTRDAAMAGIAGLLYNDATIVNGFQATIDMLYQLRGEQGQIASNYKMLNGEVEHVSFGTLSPKIDSATWYLVSIGILVHHGYQYDIEYVEPTIVLLDALEYNGQHLIYVPQGGNWADEYPYEGYILYDQVLRAWALQLLGKHFDREDWVLKSTGIKKVVESRYFNDRKAYYDCAFRPSGANDTFDFAAHCMLGLLLKPEESTSYAETLSWIINQFLRKGTLPVAFYPVIDEAHPDWRLLSRFHLFAFKNKPHHYHNGGIWFIWVGWFALVLSNHGHYEDLQQLGEIAFDILSDLDNFNFDEYLTGDTNEPQGTEELCYTATGILFLCKAMKSQKKTINLF